MCVAIFAEWVQEEESRDRVDWFPCRPLVGVGLQEGQELEDPERVVLFEDIQVMPMGITINKQYKGVLVSVYKRRSKNRTGV